MPVDVATYAFADIGRAISGPGNTPDINVAEFSGITVDCTLSSLVGTLPTVTFILERRAVDGTYMPIDAGITLSVISTWAQFSVGRGLSKAVVPGPIIRVRWVGGGTIFTSAVASIYVVGDAR